MTISPQPDPNHVPDAPRGVAGQMVRPGDAGSVFEITPDWLEALGFAVSSGRAEVFLGDSTNVRRRQWWTLNLEKCRAGWSVILVTREPERAPAWIDLPPVRDMEELASLLKCLGITPARTKSERS